MKGTGS